MSKEITVYVANDEEPLTISVSQPIPKRTGPNYAEESRAAYEDQAKRPVYAMLRSMPGGLVDAMLVELLDHKRSIFVVPHVREAKE